MAPLSQSLSAYTIQQLPQSDTSCGDGSGPTQHCALPNLPTTQGQVGPPPSSIGVTGLTTIGPARGQPDRTTLLDLVPSGHNPVGMASVPRPPSLVFGLCPVVHYQGLDPLAMDGGPTPLDTHSSVRDRLGWDVTPPPQEWGSHLTQLLIGVAFHGINFSLFPVPSPQTFFIHSGETHSGETPVMYYQAVRSGLQGSPTQATTNTL